jgi:hypothetical protein
MSAGEGEGCLLKSGCWAAESKNAGIGCGDVVLFRGCDDVWSARTEVGASVI